MKRLREDSEADDEATVNRLLALVNTDEKRVREQKRIADMAEKHAAWESMIQLHQFPRSFWSDTFGSLCNLRQKQPLISSMFLYLATKMVDHFVLMQCSVTNGLLPFLIDDMLLLIFCLYRDILFDAVGPLDASHIRKLLVYCRTGEDGHLKKHCTRFGSSLM